MLTRFTVSTKRRTASPYIKIKWRQSSRSNIIISNLQEDREHFVEVDEKFEVELPPESAATCVRVTRGY